MAKKKIIMTLTILVIHLRLQDVIVHDKDDDDIGGDNGVEKRPRTITITTTRRKNRVVMLMMKLPVCGRCNSC